MGCAAHDRTPLYRRREPEKTALYRMVAGHLETFLEECRQGGHALPSHVEGELRRYLDCGIYAKGLSRWVCESCGAERVVASSCKGRGFCPSCIGRRMSETAALLVDHVLPAVPVRQWVLTLPIELRYRLAYDGALCTRVLRVFLRAVSGWYRRRGKAMGYPGGTTGAFTVIQRANSDLRLAPHFHSVVLDGVNGDADAEDGPHFVETPAPTDEEIKALVETVARRVIRLLVRRGVLDESANSDPLTEREPVLAGLMQASVLGQSASGERAPEVALRDRAAAEAEVPMAGRHVAPPAQPGRAPAAPRGHGAAQGVQLREVPRRARTKVEAPRPRRARALSRRRGGAGCAGRFAGRR